MVKNSEKSNLLGEDFFFLGEFEHSLDSQRRIAIPSVWRQKKDSRFVLIPGRNRILQLIPHQTFREEFLSKAKRESFANASSSLALARLGSRAQECRCDKQGRIQIPQRLLDYASIRDSVMMVGSISTVQIWPVDVWQEYQISDESYLDEVQRIGEKEE